MKMSYKSNEFYWGMSEKTFIIVLHISQFAGFFVPYIGFVLPLAMWLTNKDKSVLIDEHGKNIINWLISATIYSIIAGILVVVLVGFPLLFLIAVLAIIFPIIGAVKASDEQFWKYPFTLQFIN